MKQSVVVYHFLSGMGECFASGLASITSTVACSSVLTELALATLSKMPPFTERCLTAGDPSCGVDPDLLIVATLGAADSARGAAATETELRRCELGEAVDSFDDELANKAVEETGGANEPPPPLLLPPTADCGGGVGEKEGGVALPPPDEERRLRRARFSVGGFTTTVGAGAGAAAGAGACSGRRMLSSSSVTAGSTLNPTACEDFFFKTKIPSFFPQTSGFWS